MSHTEHNKTVVRSLYEDVVGRGNLALLDRLVAADAVDHNAARSGWGSGIEGVRRHATFLHEVFPDAVLTVDDLVAEGDRVIAFWHFTGIQRGELWGVPATGRYVTARTVSIARLRDGQVVEYESRPERLELLLQLGSLGHHAAQLAASSGQAA